MKLKYTFTVEQELTSFENYKDGDDPLPTTVQEAAALEESWLKQGIYDPMDIMCNASEWTVKVEGVE